MKQIIKNNPFLSSKNYAYLTRYNEDDAHERRFTREDKQKSNPTVNFQVSAKRCEFKATNRENNGFLRLRSCKCHVEEGFSPKHPERFVQARKLRSFSVCARNFHNSSLNRGKKSLQLHSSPNIQIVAFSLFHFLIVI